MSRESVPDGRSPWQRGVSAALLLERLDELKHGRGSCLLIRGGPRSGKSSALDRLSACAQAQAIRTVSLRCRPSSIGFGANALAAISFWARGLPNAHRPAMLSQCSDGGPNGPGAASDQLSIAILSSVKRPERLVLALDDIHHADEMSLALLRSIAAAAEQLPLLVLATHVSLDLLDGRTRAALEQFAGRAFHHLELSDSNPPTVPGEQSNGHGSQSAAQPNGTASNGSAPTDDRGAMLTGLSNGERRALDIAAVLGFSFSPGQLLAIIDLDAAEAQTHLSALERHALIRRTHDGAEYSFADNALHELVYRRIAPPDRAGLHRRIARLLDALHPYDPESHAAAIAYHYVHGLDESVAERAAAFTRLAGQLAMRRGDIAGVERIYRDALRATDSAGITHYGRQCDLLIALGSAQTRLGKFVDAQASLSRAAEIASNAEDYSRLGAAVVRMPHCQWPVLAGIAGPAMQLARRALSGLGFADSVRALLIARIGFELTLAADRQQGVSMLAEALQLARESSDRRALAEVLNLFDRALMHPDSIQERLKNAAEVVALAGQLGDRDLLRHATLIRIRCLLELGELARAEAEANLLETPAAGSGPVANATALLSATMRSLREGRLDEAEELGQRFRAASASGQMPDAEDFYWPAMFAIFAEQGRLGELEPLARETLGRYPEMGVFRALLAWLYLEMGRAADARFHFERLALAGFSSFANEGGYLVCLAALSMVASEFGDRPRCVQLYELMLPYAGRAAVMGVAPGFGSIERYLGRLAAALARPAQALEHLERAVEFNRRVGGRLWCGYSTCELARVLAEHDGAGQRDRAAQLRAETIEEAIELGMRRLRAVAERIEVTEAAAQTGKPQTFAERSDRTAGPLSHNGMRAASDQGGPVNHASARPGLAVFLREADYWTLSYGGETIRVKHSRGLELIGLMLKSPGRRFHAVELCAILDGHPGSAESTTAETRPDPMLDGKARSSYRERLLELRADIEEARGLNDLDRVGKLEEEKAFLTRELARAVGLGGVDRRMASRSERARTRVTNAIRNTLHKISQTHTDLGRYLARTVKTGTFCRYDPDRSNPVSWLL